MWITEIGPYISQASTGTYPAAGPWPSQDAQLLAFVSYMNTHDQGSDPGGPRCRTSFLSLPAPESALPRHRADPQPNEATALACDELETTIADRVRGLLDDGHYTEAVGKREQDGWRRLAHGCFLAIRNPNAHRDVEYGRATAMEAIATMSMIARRVSAAAETRTDT